VTGFTGSSIWKAVAMFPPASEAMIDAGYQDFADRWNPILDVFDEVGVRFALEVHPSEIAYDYWTAKRTLEAIGHRENFGLNFDPSHFIWQDLDPVMFLQDFAEKIFHVHVGVRPSAQRPQWPARLPPSLGRPAPRVGLRHGRPWRRQLGADFPNA
jgi:sugar phosphate isomerase/epimerase